MSGSTERVGPPAKPLGRKAYGSIPHLPGSRIGPGDWHVHEGQASILCAKARDARDRITVTEKLDGSCVAVARLGEAIVPLIRAGYRADDSDHEQHRHFSRWVADRRSRFMAALGDGERMAGEWLLLAHASRYAVSSSDRLFVPFDVLAPGRKSDARLVREEFLARCAEGAFEPAHCLSDGPPLSVGDALARLGEFGFHGADGPPEGAVWRCERDGSVEFLAKFVRHGKADGSLLPGISAGAAVWNWPPADI